MKSKPAIFVEEFSLGGDGPTVAVKDTIDIAGYPTRAGSRALADVAPAKRNAVIVDALIAAGCRIVGKTNLHEFAYGVTGINAYTGTALNTRFPDRVPGGSSSGSAAAVAAGLVDFAVGTDTGGSVRIPAACCGVTGYKPTFGRISRAGVMPPVSTLDCVGPFAQTVDGIERAMAILDPAFVAVAPPVDPLIGVVSVECEPDVAAAFDRAIAALPFRTRPVTLAGMPAAFDAGLALIGAETFAAVGAYADSPAIGADIRDRLAAARRIPPAAIVDAERVRATFTAEVDAAFANGTIAAAARRARDDRTATIVPSVSGGASYVIPSGVEGQPLDVLVLPTMPIPTLTLEQGSDAKAAIPMTAFVRPFNLSGHPALTIPLPAANGFSAGLQLVGRRGGDAELLALAREIERAVAGRVTA